MLLVSPLCRTARRLNKLLWKKLMGKRSKRFPSGKSIAAWHSGHRNFPCLWLTHARLVNFTQPLGKKVKMTREKLYLQVRKISEIESHNIIILLFEKKKKKRKEKQKQCVMFVANSSWEETISRIVQLQEFSRNYSSSFVAIRFDFVLWKVLFGKSPRQVIYSSGMLIFP